MRLVGNSLSLHNGQSRHTPPRFQANTVASSNASALVLINHGQDSEELFRVAATLGGHSGGDEEPKGPENMPTVSHHEARRGTSGVIASIIVPGKTGRERLTLTLNAW